MKSDHTELYVLAAAQLGKVKELTDKWESWAERAQVKPYPEGGGGNKGKEKKKAP